MYIYVCVYIYIYIYAYINRKISTTISTEATARKFTYTLVFFVPIIIFEQNICTNLSFEQVHFQTKLKEMQSYFCFGLLNKLKFAKI